MISRNPQQNHSRENLIGQILGIQKESQRGQETQDRLEQLQMKIKIQIIEKAFNWHHRGTKGKYLLEIPLVIGTEATKRNQKVNYLTLQTSILQGNFKNRARELSLNQSQFKTIATCIKTNHLKIRSYQSSSLKRDLLNM
ncbi:hypothetical protein FGO68_gene184 [Halteria grandinella]|uniref:Uncharacterized protein n=1 Tax=Halteria grandinella TaxID=5974 RepID=A0A8J8T2N7_HALGN|nr:hypothetical protein FGO68_gene184 [Halteria grandinella]